MIEKLGITPGPWKLADKRQICKSDGGIIITAWWYGNKGTVSDQQAEGNARLIAAAPDMLEALIRCLNLKNDVDSWEHCNFVSIIEKATGKTWEEIWSMI